MSPAAVVTSAQDESRTNARRPDCLRQSYVLRNPEITPLVAATAAAGPASPTRAPAPAPRAAPAAPTAAASTTLSFTAHAFWQATSAIRGTATRA
ncbi:MAG: hypothetical protein EBS76_05880 [Actinobacteria bacterium]|nr:hypothetical protein [Actinomycetota bacterium]